LGQKGNNDGLVILTEYPLSVLPGGDFGQVSLNFPLTDVEVVEQGPEMGDETHCLARGASCVPPHCHTVPCTPTIEPALRLPDFIRATHKQLYQSLGIVKVDAAHDLVIPICANYIV